MTASSVVNARRRLAAAAGVPVSAVSCKSSVSSHNDAGVVRDMCFVKPGVNYTNAIFSFFLFLPRDALVHSAVMLQ